jgi:hypothetical protein
MLTGIPQEPGVMAMGKHGQHEDEGVISLRNAFLQVPKYSASRPTPPSAKWSCNIFETLTACTAMEVK